MRRAVPAIVALAVGCGSDPVAIEPQTDKSADYNRAALFAAVDKFIAEGRTPAAFGALVAEVDRLRPGMDETVAEEAELKLVTLALTPVESVATQPIRDQVEVLATTVWSFALRPAIVASAPDGLVDRRAAEVAPRPGEDGPTYLLRVCGDALAVLCKHAVPEMQGAVVRGNAVQRLTSRARNAVAGCIQCSTDPGWKDIVSRYEALDIAVTSTLVAHERAAEPGNWPVAGSASERWPVVPPIQVEEDGDLLIDDQPVPPQLRVAELQTQFAARGAIALHVPPAAPVTRLISIVADARRGGITEVVVAAREPQYPWTLRAYRIAAAARARRIAVRPGDTVQVLLRAIDADLEDKPALVRID
jgi:hypothetical protein